MKKFILVLLVLALALSATACNNDSTGNGDNGDFDTNAPYMINYSEEMKDVSLNVYSVSDITHVLDAFTEDTGITANVLQMTNGEILQRVQHEKDSGQVLADIWYRGGADAFVDAASKGYFSSYKSHELENFADYTKDEEGYWSGTTMTLVGWVVNTAILEELDIDLPTKWDDLLNPKLKDMVSMPNPAISGTAYNTVSGILQVRGHELGWEYFDQLIEQVPFFTPRGSDPTNLVMAGEAAIGIIATFGERDMRNNENPVIKLIYPEDGTGWWPQPLAILDGAPNGDAAKVFVDWVLSERGMTRIIEMDSVLGLRQGIESPEELLRLDNVNLFPTDFEQNALQRDEILEIWTQKVTAAGK